MGFQQYFSSESVVGCQLALLNSQDVCLSQETSRWGRRFVEERQKSGLLDWDTTVPDSQPDLDNDAELNGLTQDVLHELCTHEEAFFREQDYARSGEVSAMKATGQLVSDSAPVSLTKPVHQILIHSIASRAALCCSLYRCLRSNHDGK